MRWGIFADIHSNLEALDAVLTAFKKEQIDSYLCLGDIVGYGADPNQCIEAIKRLNPQVIAGNHDWATVGLFGCEYFRDYAKEAILWTTQRLTDTDKDFLQGLQLVHQQKELTLVHGSLHNPEQFEYIFDIVSAQKTFQHLQTKVCFIGHTHRPITYIQKGEDCGFTFQAKVKLEAADAYIVNAGSVGQPRDGNPQACYLVYDSEKQEVEIKRVSYDVPKAQQKIMQTGLPQILAERLAIGR